MPNVFRGCDQAAATRRLLRAALSAIRSWWGSRLGHGVKRFELANHSLGPVVEGGDHLVGVFFRVVKTQVADREIDDFMTVPRSRRG
jgi:hypothetical protein